MSHLEQIADLLQVPPGTTHPNAYQIVGLAPLEDDRGTIDRAIKAKSRHLQEQKAAANPNAWKAAVVTFKKAAAILSDLEQKKKYDAILRAELRHAGAQAAAKSSSAPPPSTPPTGLEGLLPEADPSAPFDPEQYAAQNPGLAEGEGSDEPEDLDSLLFGADAAAAEQEDAEEQVQLVIPDRPSDSPEGLAGIAIPQPVRRRRRKFPLTGALMGLVVMGLFAGIIAMVYVLANREEQIGPVNVQVADPRPLPEDEIPAEPNPRRPRDPVMGNLPAAESAPPIAEEPAAEPFQMPAPGEKEPGENESDASMGNEPEMTAAQPQPDPNAPSSPANANAEPSEPAPGMPDPEPIAAAETALQSAFATVANRDWDQMRTAAEKAESAAVTEPQQQQARRLDRLVRYALEYRRAIRDGAAKIGAGDSFELTAGIRVGMVEASEERVVIRAQGDNKRYAGFDDIPLILAHAFARMDLDAEHPTTITYKAAYQALAEKSTADQRQEAFGWWDDAAGQTDEVNTEGLQQLVEQVLPESQ